MKVSVVIITYNQARFIAQAIEGALRQVTSFDYEIVIGEDDSTDGTRQIVLDYQARYPEKIKVLLHDRAGNILVDGKPTAIRNIVNAICAAQGEYIALVEGDDYWSEPSKLQAQADFLDSHPDYSICFHNACCSYESGDHPSSLYCPPDLQETFTLEDVIVSHFMPTCSVMFRRASLPEFPDWFFTLRMSDKPLYILLSQHGKIGYLNKVMGVYRIHGAGEWSGKDMFAKIKETLDLLQKIDQHLQHQYQAKVMEAIALHWDGWMGALANTAYEKGDYASAAQTADGLITRYMAHLPYSKADLRRLRGKVDLGLLFASYAQRDFLRSLHFLLRILFHSPTQLSNRGIWSLGVEAYLGPRSARGLRATARRIFSFLLIFTWLSASLGWGSPGPVFAQNAGTGVQWDAPVNVSNTLTASTRPTVAVDRWGGIHMFWSEDAGGKPVKANETPRAGNTIYYRQLRDGAWSFPVDLFFVDGGMYTDPEAAVDQNGQVHVVWASNMGAMYSNAPADKEASAKYWDPAYVLDTRYMVDQVEIAVGLHNELYVAYNTSQQNNSALFFTRSENSGVDWSAPLEVSGLIEENAGLVMYPQIVVDEQGNIFLLWLEHTGEPNFKGLGLYISVSNDHGESWSKPYQVMSDMSGGVLASTGNNTLVCLGIGESVTHRYYRYSTDNGLTWSSRKQVFGEFISRAGWDAIAVDGAGVAHLIVQLRYPEALYNSTWKMDEWVDLPEMIIGEPPLSYAHFPHIVVSQGDQLHVALEEHPGGEIWYMHGVASAPHTEPDVLPGNVEQAPTPTVVPTLVESKHATQTAPIKVPPYSPPSPLIPILSGGSAVILFLALAVVWNRFFKR